MFTKIYWIEKWPTGSKIGIMPRPKGNDWLSDEIRQLKVNGVQVVISLLERDEVYELGLQDEKNICTACGMTFLNLPIPDRGLPGDLREVERLINEARTRLGRGESIVIHCRMGIGRSSIIAAAILMTDNKSVEEIINLISAVRGVSVPDTDEQLNWLRQMRKDYPTR